MKSYREITGDGGSGIVEQVEARRARLEENLGGVSHLVAVGSGKGGVGKSTLTRQLASALRAADRSCAILDADLNGPTQARLTGLGTAPLVPGNRGVVLPRNPEGIGVVSLGAMVPESEAVDFAGRAGDSHIWRATKEFTALSDLLTTVEWGELDFLLADLPPGAERTLQFAEFFGPRAAFALVTIPSELARGVVSRSVAALRASSCRILGYVENMQGYYCRDCDRVRPLFPESVSAELGIPCLGSVPFDPELAALSDRGQPFAVDSRHPAAQAVRELAARLVAAMEVAA
jgi:ATP-binding protein involved in chromosome partitioning